jgi:hypothetical protein
VQISRVGQVEALRVKRSDSELLGCRLRFDGYGEGTGGPTPAIVPDHFPDLYFDFPLIPSLIGNH